MRASLSLRSLAAAGAAMLLVACASGSGSSSSGSPASSQPGVAKDPALAALVPAGVASDGKLVIGTDASYAPNEFVDTDGKTVIGWDVDLAKAVGQVLGLQVAMQNAPFDSLVEGVKSGKFDMGVASFTINPKREQQVDMISYYSAGTSWAVPKGNPEGITPDSACGKKVAVQKGTVQVDDIAARSAKCTSAGKPAIAVEQFQLQSDATSAVVTGKDDAMLADSPVVAYAVKQTGDKLELVGQTYDTAPYGMIVPKTDPNFAKAIQGALQKLMDGGTYQAILTTWGVEGGAVSSSQINPVS